MLLSLIRDTFTPAETLGKLMIDGKPFCDTLEPPVVPNVQHPKGTIPEGWYKVQVTRSPKFGRLLPLLYYVPGFEGIRIHAGNNRDHTSGCILVGERAERYEPTANSPSKLEASKVRWTSMVAECGVDKRGRVFDNSATIGIPCLYSSRRTEEALTQELNKAQNNHEEINIEVTNTERYSSEHACNMEFALAN